jgi:hypothetical protein
MAKYTKRTDRHRFWQKHIKAWKKSGDTQSAYCSSVGLSQEHFSLWKKRLPAGMQQQKHFAEIHVPAVITPDSASFEVTIGTIAIRIPQHFDAASVKIILSLIRELC